MRAPTASKRAGAARNSFTSTSSSTASSMPATSANVTIGPSGFHRLARDRPNCITPRPPWALVSSQMTTPMMSSVGSSDSSSPPMGDDCWPSTCTCTLAATSAVVRSSPYSAGKVVWYEVPSVSVPLTTWSRSATLAVATSPAASLAWSSERLSARPESPPGSWDTMRATASATAARTTKIPGGRSSFRTIIRG